LVNKGVVTTTKVQIIGNYQGIDYNKEVPITDNFNNVTVTEEKNIPSANKINIDDLNINYALEVNVYAGTDENTNLSNFSSSKPFTISGEKFNTVEGYFQARKMDYSNDYYNSSIPGNMEMSIAKLEKFKTAKGANARLMGRELTGLKKEQWDAASTEILKEGMLESFLQNPKAAAELLATGNALLTHKNEKGIEQDNGRFSRLLMEIREQLYQMSLQDKQELPTFEEKDDVDPFEAKKGVDPVYQDLADRIDIEKFDAFFPQYAELSIDEKINFLKSANEDELKIVCKII
jgi:ribA/ribD-fused uncharacterized protein